MREIEKTGWLDAHANRSLQITPALLTEHLEGVGYKNFMATAMGLTLPTHKFLVAMLKGQISGYGIFRQDLDTNGNARAEILHLYVDTPSRGMGIGRALLDTFLKWVKPEAKIVVNVVAHNRQAIGFYEQYGFKSSANRPVSKIITLSNGAMIPEIEMFRMPSVGA